MITLVLFLICCQLQAVASLHFAPFHRTKALIRKSVPLSTLSMSISNNNDDQIITIDSTRTTTDEPLTNEIFGLIDPSIIIIKPIKETSGVEPSQTVSEPTISTTPPHIPSYKELLKFAVPTLGIWLLQPILSLIDTSVVGLSKASNIAELAAIGPGVAWIDSTTYLCYSIGMSFTNLYAVSLADPDELKQQTALSHAGFISIAVGVLLTLIQFSLSGTMIRVISGTAKEVIPYGIIYARIRSLGSLVSIPMMIAQSAFLVQKDTFTPLIATLVGAIVNIIGDVWLVTYLNKGVAGAAVATTLSQLASFLFLLYRVNQSMQVNCKKTKVSVRTYLNTRIKIPTIQDILQFASFSGPLFAILLVKSFLWSFTTFACSTVGAAKLAAHQITLNGFIFLAIFGDVISQIAQTYLPSIFTSIETIQDKTKSIIMKKDEDEDKDKESIRDYNINIKESYEYANMINITDCGIDDSSKISAYIGTPAVSVTNIFSPDTIATQTAILKQALGIISKRVFNLSVSVAAFTAVAAILMQTVGAKFVTTSMEVVKGVRSLAWLLAACVMPYTIMATFEGILVAGRDSNYLAQAYSISGLVFLLYQEWVRRNGLGLQAVWLGLAIFQWVRLAMFGVRLKGKMKR